MKKSILPLTMVLFTVLLTSSFHSTKAQMPAQHVTTVNTQYMLPTDSAGRAERNALVKEYFDKVIMKNQYILHEWNMTHYYSDDSREFLIIDEYASWADVEKANDRNEELEKQAWPDPKQRADYYAKLNKYFGGHKDAIYHSFPNMTK